LPAQPSALERIQGRAAQSMKALPRQAKLRLARGAPVVRDGLTLDPDIQLMLVMSERTHQKRIEDLPVPEAREEFRRQVLAVADRSAPVLPRVEPFVIPVGDGATVGARLYAPAHREGGTGLLVHFHGGGHTVGDLDTCEHTCRLLAHHAGVGVLSVDYRLGPEHRFPAAADDAFAAFLWATENAERLGADPDRIAVGGDSAGGNLGAVVCLDAAAAGGPAPAFQFLIYPVCDYSVKHESIRLFSEGFLLTEREMDWFRDNYLADEAARSDPRVSPLLAADLSGLPPAYVATAGFDPLRDEGEAYAARLAEAGVPVALQRHDSLVHGYVNLTGISRVARDAVLQAAGALRQGLAAPAA
jgi:acetyl esterase/lipase